MREALEMNMEAMDRAHEIAKFDRQTLGFDVDVWLTVMRGQTLVMLGRGEEARPFLDRILGLESSQVDVFHRRENGQSLPSRLCPGVSRHIPHCRWEAYFSH